MAERLRVAVLFGGKSGEHEVSLRSARSIMNAIDRTRYEVIPVGISKAGRWFLLDPAQGEPTEGLARGEGTPVTLVADPTRAGFLPLSPQGGAGDDLVQVDVVFPVLHGTYGEDGTVQGLLELANLAYVGPGVLGSAVAMDKEVMKDLFVRHGLPVLPYLTVYRRDWERDPEPVMDRIEAELGYPVFVKPANLGSSVGINKAADRQQLAAALAEAAEYDGKLVVEKGLNKPRELEVSILGNHDPQASVPGEIVPGAEFYDYRAKYIDDTSELLIPAPVPGDVAQETRRLAIAAYKALHCEGLSRVDLFLTDQGELYLNEINTIPGFTSISMYPKLWEATGLPYTDLIDRLIRLAVERWEDKQRNRTSYDAAG